MNKLRHFVPLLLVLFANFLGFGILALVNGGMQLQHLYYSLALLGVVVVSYAIILFFSLGDDYLFLIVSMLLTVGILVLFRIKPEDAMHQIIWFYAGTAGFFVVYTIFRLVKVWHKIYYIYLAVAAFLFMVTLVFGRSIGGAKNWIYVGSIGVQPSELIKISFVLMLAGMYSAPYTFETEGNFIKRMFSSEWGRQFIIMAAVYMHLGFLVLQREWGSAVLYFLIYIVMQYIFGKKPVILIFNALLVVAAGTLGYFALSHIQERVAVWLDPFGGAADGYQIIQSLYGMASGGFIGSGLGLGHPNLIPVVKSDFIFSAIYEELGMVGAVGVILLYFLLVYRSIKISLRAKKDFHKALALGLGAMFGFQTFIIIGGVTKFIPMTGITLPFISAGGSSLAASFAALAILHAISGKKELADEI